MRKLNRNDRVLVMCVGVFAAMIGLTYASVPLYRIFCQATGYDGTPRIFSAASTNVVEGSIEVRFDANVGQGLPWKFSPDKVAMNVRLGENSETFYRARNLSADAIVGKATYNITPAKAGKYFNKIQCFCFDNQKLYAGQLAKLGVAFFVDPAIANDPETKDVTSVTLSYTFFPAKSETNKTIAAVVPR